jgi:hypothetical protein
LETDREISGSTQAWDGTEQNNESTKSLSGVVRGFIRCNPGDVVVDVDVLHERIKAV